MEIGAIVLPVILMLVLGTFLKSKEMIGSECVSGIKNIIANIMLPVVLFNAISMAGFTGNDLKLVAGIYGVFTVILALGFILFAFTIFLFAIKAAANGSVDKKRLVMDSLRSPIIIAVTLGLVMSVTGLGRMFMASHVFPVYGSMVEMVTGPLTVLVLITVGYDLVLDQSIMIFVVKVSLVRLLLNGCGLAVIFFLFRSFWSDK